MVKSMLLKKLLRDIRRSAMQFVALVFLCILGTLLFTGIDSIASMIRATNDAYFTENHLANFWVTVPEVNRDALLRVQNVPGVKGAEARFSVDMESELQGEPLVNVVGCHGGMDINRPIVRSGEALVPGDRRGCLLQAGFADAHGLRVGNSIVLKQESFEYSFVVRGIVYSPEFISISSSGFPGDAAQYGYILVNADALAHIPLTQMVVETDGTISEARVEQGIRNALPYAMIVNRKAHRSTVTAVDNEIMFRNISLVFPVAAFLVSALIVMTTLTRMIENQRVQIGTLKALGYSERKIRGHYLSYAFWPSLIGSVSGAIIGHLTVPQLIWVLLIGKYEYPYQIIPGISIAAWGMVLFSVGVSVFICLRAYQKTARESAAALLRGKPPKDGRRLLLERITPLWKRLSFNGKMVVRNLMRNKMRTLMSCIGLLCCNALIIASMGLQDSISLAADNHYQKALRYNLLVTLNEKAGNVDAYKQRLDAEGVECVMEMPVRIFTAQGERTTLLTVVEEEQRMLWLGKEESYLPIESGALVITEKLAKTLLVAIGDMAWIQPPGEKEAIGMPVGQIVYNNLAQGLYLTQSTWEGLRKGAFRPTHIQLYNPSAACVAMLGDMTEVQSTKTSEEQKKDLLSALDMLSSVFVILMVIALALAFVICYNMGLINFAERTREYATLKVLGYHQKEIRRLIMNENMMITVLAIFLSILPGVGFTGMILTVAETESAFYTANILPASMILSSVITFLFSCFIQWFLVRRVQHIVMVEALKSVE